LLVLWFLDFFRRNRNGDSSEGEEMKEYKEIEAKFWYEDYQDGNWSEEGVRVFFACLSRAYSSPSSKLFF